MRLLLVAVGQRMPAWAEDAYQDFAKRFPPELRLELKARQGRDTRQQDGKQLMAAEAARIEAAMPKGVRRIVLDERGTRRTTVELAERLKLWMGEGRDAALIIGGRTACTLTQGHGRRDPASRTSPCPTPLRACCWLKGCTAPGR